MTANIRGVAVCPHNIDTDTALMSLQPKLKAAGDRTFSPVLSFTNKHWGCAKLHMFLA